MARRGRIWVWTLRAACVSALVLVFVLAVTPRPPQILGGMHDKALHMTAFLVLTPLTALAWTRLSTVALALLLGAFGGLIEAVQAIPALHREASALDWLVDVLAVLLGLVLVVLVRSERAL